MNALIERFNNSYIPCPTSGCWLWNLEPGYDGRYGKLTISRKTKLAHRVAYELFVGPIPKGFHIDHKCMNGLCVNPNHLRLCTSSENNAHRNIPKNNTSGIKGVVKRKNGWLASIAKNKKRINLGLFDTIEEAQKAYQQAATELFGEFANF